MATNAPNAPNAPYGSNWPLSNPGPSSPIADIPTSPPPTYSNRRMSKQDIIEATSQIPKRRPLSATANLPDRTVGLPLSPTYTNKSFDNQPRISRKASFEAGDDAYMRKPVIAERENQDLGNGNGNGVPRSQAQSSNSQGPVTQSIPYRQRQTVEASELLHQPQSGIISSAQGSAPSSRNVSGNSVSSSDAFGQAGPEPLHYHHRLFEAGNRRASADSSASAPQPRKTSREEHYAASSHGRLTPASQSLLGADLARPVSAYSSASEGPRRTLSPGNIQNVRTPSPSRHSPSSRPMSYVDLLNVPYPQPPPAPTHLDNSQLRSSVGQNASLLSTKKTLEMYRANAKKTNDPTIQYEFAIFMVTTAQELAATEGLNIHAKPRHSTPNDSGDGSSAQPADLLREARQLLQKLSDRSYPFAQYYLGDGYASGLFSKGEPDNERAFPLFIAASKHGHAEAGYRAALCYEFGWGCRKDFPKAVQFYRQSASKNHPGAMSRLGSACLVGDLGLGNRYREGFKWLKRAAESADFQYNSAPYELGLLHETGYGDDIFRDESYAAQLFTQSADLGHVEANYRLGDAYEHGKLSCPKDPALSVHFYTGAAQRGHPLAMMALCAWYMVGAEPVLEKDEAEAYEWAKKAAETGLPKAEYAVGYFTEMGIGCRRDPLEANVWYVKAADQGDDRAKHRIAAIRAAASGGSGVSGGPGSDRNGGESTGKEKGKKWGIF